ncbi:hypothetical protein [uncultured Corynebacterium sp.]|uniref:hypothetical protein n=1 Tax=uncultured Corynebacterium sp. TaxID=159447 RepID=UPI0025CECFCA|nr:hypothetical protein [uncultured Corynebacterium sp.]
MTAHYDFYGSLGLDQDAPTSDLRSSIQSTLDDLRRDGVPEHDARVQENSAALSVLGDDRLRSLYDARLADDSAPRMGIPELRRLATTGSFGDDHAAPTKAGAASSESTATQQGAYQQGSFQQAPFGQPQNQQTPYGQAPYGQPQNQQSPYGPVPYGQPQNQQAPYQQAPKPKPAMPESPDNPHLKTLLTSPPGTVKALAAVLLAIAIVSVLTLLAQVISMAATSYGSIYGTLWDMAATVLAGYALPLVGSALAAALLLPKVLRGRDNGLVIPLVIVSATFIVLTLGMAITFAGAGTITAMVLLAIGFIAIPVLTFLPDTRAWFNGSWTPAAATAAPSQGPTGPVHPQSAQSGQQAQYPERTSEPTSDAREPGESGEPRT